MRPSIRFIYIVLIATVLGALSFGGNLAWFVTDALWFGVVGQEEVFWSVFWARATLFGLGALATVAIIFGNAWWALRGGRGPVALPRDMMSSPVGRLLRRMNPSRPLFVLSLVLGGFFGLLSSVWWEELLLFQHGGSFDFTDPILGYDASFYMFTLPLVQTLRFMAFILVTVGAFVAGGLYVLQGAMSIDFVEVQRGQYMVRGFDISEPARKHVAAIVLVLGSLMAAGSWLRRFDEMTDLQRGDLLTGPGYADVVATFPLLGLETVATVIGAGLLAFGVLRLQRGPSILGAGIAGVSWALTAFIPGIVQSLIVLPNELAKEGEYLEHHVAATRFAFDLDEVESRSLSGDAGLSRKDIEENQLTVESVRLWDHGPLLATFGQVQEIRTYYDFLSVDNDRYVVDGSLRQTMLSPRELVNTSLPAQARTFVNEMMTYTHGYGVAVGPVNQVTPEGLPELWVKDLPPRVNTGEDVFQIDRPEIYFGEAAGHPVFINTKNKEFDYPSGEENTFTSYAGQAGVQLENLLIRGMIAARMGDAQVLLSSDLQSDSRALLYRNIVDRVERIAPFLRLDSDPYMVIDEGRLKWVLDAYTMSRRFPYAQQSRIRANYMRNSVKVVVDAYDGSLIFYKMQVDDPVIDAWEKAFPNLFVSESEIPDSLRAHLRYPKDYFTVQAHLFATFHMTESQIFYNREDEWEVPVIDGRQMEPYYTIMKLPNTGGETNAEEFILMLPFTPRGKPNLAAWMVARSDGESYGTLRVYAFPKEKMVYGPKMIVARFNQNDEISEKMSLWNQQGSAVELGTLLVIPIEESLLYIQPLYLKAEQGSIPELKRVIVGYENQIAMEPTLEASLGEIFGRREVVTAQDSGDATNVEAATWMLLVQEANIAWEASTKALSGQDWSAYGASQDRLKRILDELERMALVVEPGENEASMDDEPTAPIEAE